MWNNAWWLITSLTGEIIIAGELLLNGYLRIGDWTVCNGIGMADLSPSNCYALNATSSYTGNGYVNNKDNILRTPDGNYAYLNSGSYGNKAEITATLSDAPISGTLYLRCYTPSANGANLKVYVCNQYGVWTQVVNTNLYPANDVMNVNCGYVGNIVKTSIVAYHEYNGYPSYIYVDATWMAL
ncbi:MAG: hypothetical protein LBE76_03725 [Nitrososphaerota archaeon]|nr:hypothetical protein [Nitrososphaerota archaeon]